MTDGLPVLAERDRRREFTSRRDRDVPA